MVEEIPYEEIIDETCPSCRQTVPRGSVVCPHCGYRIREEVAPPAAKVRAPAPTPVRTATNKAGIAGVLIIVSGILALVMGAYLAADPSALLSTFEDMGLEISRDVAVAAGGLSFIFGIIAIIGGAMALKRKHWGVAVAGGVLAFLGSGAIIGSIIGLIGLILVIMARREFTR